MSVNDKEFHKKFNELMEDPDTTLDEKFAIMLSDPEWKARFIKARDRTLAESEQITKELEEKGVLYQKQRQEKKDKLAPLFEGVKRLNTKLGMPYFCSLGNYLTALVFLIAFVWMLFS